MSFDVRYLIFSTLLRDAIIEVSPRHGGKADIHSGASWERAKRLGRASKLVVVLFEVNASPVNAFSIRERPPSGWIYNDTLENPFSPSSSTVVGADKLLKSSLRALKNVEALEVICPDSEIARIQSIQVWLWKIQDFILMGYSPNYSVMKVVIPGNTHVLSISFNSLGRV